MGLLNPITAASIGAVSKGDLVINVQDYGAVGDGTTDDMGAFQRASNVLYAAGGGTMLLPKSSYYLSQYTGADVSNTICGTTGVASGTVSKTWVIPTNTTIDGHGHTKLTVNGGSSSALGFSLSANILAWSGSETIVTGITAASNSARSVTMPSTTGFSVGQLVRLGRSGGTTGGIPNTPSLEPAPNQFLTIASIVGLVITFQESFLHNFEAAQSLELAYTASGKYCRNVFINDVTVAAGAARPYVLISRTINSGVNHFQLDDASMSWGTCEGVNVGTMRLRIITDYTVCVTVESVSRVSIDSFDAYGNGSTNGLGGMFFTDNNREVHVKRYSASNYTQTGLAVFYSGQYRFDTVTLTDCGTAAVLDAYAGALTVGFPAAGAVSSYASAQADTWKMRNLGNTRIHIGTLSIRGASQVPVRIHDADIGWDYAYIEFANTASPATAPIVIGQSGERRADGTYYPLGGQSSFRRSNTRVKTVAGSAVAPVSAVGGYNTLFRQGDTTLSGAASISDTTLAVIDGTKLKAGLVYFINTASGGNTPVTATISSITGNTATLSAALTVAIPSGAGVWQFTPLATNVMNRVTMDGVIQDDALVSLPLSYTYNTDGTLATVVSNGAVTSYAYNGDGSVHTDTFNGTTRTYSYDGSGNLIGIV